MRIRIFYYSRTGTTADCVGLLQKNLERQDVSTVKIEKGRNYDFSACDMVILGGPVRFGRLSRLMRGFMRENEKELTSKPLGLFFLCGYTDREEEYAETVFPESLIKHSFDVAFFGGEMNSKRAENLIDKIVIHKVRSDILIGGDNGTGRENASLPCILEDNISKLADKIKSMC